MKRSRNLVLKEREVHRLKDHLRKRILKVASEQRSPTQEKLVGYDGFVHVIGYDKIK